MIAPPRHMSRPQLHLQRDLPKPDWHTPSPPLTITPDAIHIWRFPLDLHPRRITQLQQQLSIREQHQATRYRFHRDTTRFIIGRSLLRSILSHYLIIAPQQIQLQANPYGKPQLTPLQNPANIQFNLAHSHELAVCAVTQRHPVGIDLEYHRVVPEAATILKYYAFNNDPQHDLTSTVNQPDDTLFKRWVCTEAFVKARGTGFTSTYIYPRSLPRAQDAGSAPIWSLWTFVPAPDYSAAVVADTPYLQLQFHDVPDIL